MRLVCLSLSGRVDLLFFEFCAAEISGVGAGAVGG